MGKMSKKALSLMCGLLEMEPKARLTGIEAMQHEYFDDVREKED